MSQLIENSSAKLSGRRLQTVVNLYDRLPQVRPTVQAPSAPLQRTAITVRPPKTSSAASRQKAAGSNPAGGTRVLAVQRRFSPLTSGSDVIWLIFGLSLPCLLGNDNTTRGTIHDIRNHTPDHPPTAARPEQLLPRDNGYACHEVAVEKLGKFTVRVWRHLHRDCDGTRFEFDATIDGLVDASSHCSNSC